MEWLSKVFLRLSPTRNRSSRNLTGHLFRTSLSVRFDCVFPPRRRSFFAVGMFSLATASSTAMHSNAMPATVHAAYYLTCGTLQRRANCVLPERRLRLHRCPPDSLPTLPSSSRRKMLRHNLHRHSAAEAIPVDDEQKCDDNKHSPLSCITQLIVHLFPPPAAIPPPPKKGLLALPN